jgi:hypothetical protein
MTANWNELREQAVCEIKMKVIEKHYDDLCKYLEPRRHFSFLRSKSVLSQDDQEAINCLAVRTERCQKFLDILMTKGNSGFDELCASLQRERTQPFLLQELNLAYERDYSKWCRENMVEYSSGSQEPSEYDIADSLPLPPRFSIPNESVL